MSIKLTVLFVTGTFTVALTVILQQLLGLLKSLSNNCFLKLYFKSVRYICNTRQDDLI